MRPPRRTFKDKTQLAEALAEAVAANLKTGIKAKGQASLAVSGGSTPMRFFKALSTRADVEWDKVTVTLVDERWVDEASERSNARLVRANLLQGRAAIAHFVPLYQGGSLDEAAIARTNAALLNVPQPLDAAVLGMGNDGHTSWYFRGGVCVNEAAIHCKRL